MRVLLDSCVLRKLAREISAHEVQTAPQLGWGDLDDGPLLTAISGGFDAFITVDKSLRHQQNLSSRLFGVIILRAKTNRLLDLLPLVPELRAVLDEILPGEVREIGIIDDSK